METKRERSGTERNGNGRERSGTGTVGNGRERGTPRERKNYSSILINTYKFFVDFNLPNILFLFLLPNFIFVLCFKLYFERFRKIKIKEFKLLRKKLYLKNKNRASMQKNTRKIVKIITFN